MSLQLFEHPFSSYCQKALIALYEHAMPFEFRMLGAELEKRWPLKRFPVLLDATTSPDPAVAKRAFDAMMTMGKIDVAKIEAAVRGETVNA